MCVIAYLPIYYLDNFIIVETVTEQPPLQTTPEQPPPPPQTTPEQPPPPPPTTEDPETNGI